eukprot:6198405-Pleurochrysis_carterae.AAC.1
MTPSQFSTKAVLTANCIIELGRSQGSDLAARTESLRQRDLIASAWCRGCGARTRLGHFFLANALEQRRE